METWTKRREIGTYSKTMQLGLSAWLPQRTGTTKKLTKYHTAGYYHIKANGPNREVRIHLWDACHAYAYMKAARTRFAHHAHRAHHAHPAHHVHQAEPTYSKGVQGAGVLTGTRDSYERRRGVKRRDNGAKTERPFTISVVRGLLLDLCQRW